MLDRAGFSEVNKDVPEQLGETSGRLNRSIANRRKEEGCSSSPRSLAAELRSRRRGSCQSQQEGAQALKSEIEQQGRSAERIRGAPAENRRRS